MVWAAVMVVGSLAAPAWAEPGGAKVATAAAGEQVEARSDSVSPLLSRVGQPSETALRAFGGAGANPVVQHRLTPAESDALGRALAALPSLHKKILKKHLRRLSFVNAPSSPGSALTSRVEAQGDGLQFDITLSSSLFAQTVTDFLNRKEERLFYPDQSGYRVHIEAGDHSVIDYILLHEATHIVDMVLDIGNLTPDGLHSGIWKDGKRSLAAPYDTNPISRILWRGGQKLPLSEAPALYEGLANSPFASLYSAAAAGEDAAETIAWHQLSTRFGWDLRIEVRDKEGAVIYALEPLKSRLLRARFPLVEKLLARDLK